MARTTEPGVRAQAKERTRQKAIDAARKAFGSVDYHSVTIRQLAEAMGMSTGAIFASFDGKAHLWREAMGSEPPADTSLTRAAPVLRKALGAAINGLARNSEAWIEAQHAIELADTPLDGEVWARHLKATRSAAPHSSGAEAASSDPSGDAAA